MNIKIDPIHIYLLYLFSVYEHNFDWFLWRRFQSPEITACSHHYGKAPKGACKILGGFLNPMKESKERFLLKKKSENAELETKEFLIYWHFKLLLPRFLFHCSFYMMCVSFQQYLKIACIFLCHGNRWKLRYKIFTL